MVLNIVTGLEFRCLCSAIFPFIFIYSSFFFFTPFYKQIFITIGPEILVKELASLGGRLRMGFLVAQLRSVSKLQQSWDEVLLRAGPDSSAGALT